MLPPFCEFEFGSGFAEIMDQGLRQVSLEEITGQSCLGSIAAGKRQGFQSPQILGGGGIEVDIGSFGQRDVVEYPFQSRPDQQSKGQIGIGGAVGTAKLKTAVF